MRDERIKRGISEQLTSYETRKVAYTCRCASGHLIP